MEYIAAAIFFGLAYACYRAMRRYDSTNIGIAIVGIVCMILGIISLLLPVFNQ
jgi:drug/metabolite transporter (DMT)-like permease